MDFTADTLADGRGFRTLNIVDDFTRECVAIEVDRSLLGLRVARVLDRLHGMVGLPKAIVVDNGPEFAGHTLDAWAYTRGVELRWFGPDGAPRRSVPAAVKRDHAAELKALKQIAADLEKVLTLHISRC